MLARRATDPGLDRRRHRPAAQHAAARRRPSTARRSPTSASTSTASAARSRRMLGGRQVTRFKRDGEQYDVIVQVADSDRTEPDDIAAIYVRGRDGAMIQLSNLVKIKETVAPKELNHFNQLRAATMTAQPRARLHAGRGARRSSTQPRARCCPTTAQTDYRRPVARVPRSPAAARLLTFVLALALHLSGAGGAVRELHRSAHHHAHRAAVDDRRAAGAVADRRHAQRLQPDRPRDAGRPDHQARHPDRRVRQPAARAGARRGATR